MQHQIRNFDPLTSFRRRASIRRRPPALLDARNSDEHLDAAGEAGATTLRVRRYDGATDIQRVASERRPRRPRA
ncbi:MAG: hypothetical protein ACRDJE_14715 [Dehalococcoidia bacterium]